MKIAIDCRYIGKSGIGRVCEGLLDHLDYEKNVYYLIGDIDKLQKYNKAILIADNTNPFSKKGLFHLQKKRINRECDCMIIPNFIIPFGIKIPVHSVMHDLIFLDVKETVNGKIDYKIKKYLLKRAMKKSKSIACVSNFTKSRCEYHFKKYAHKCYVNYNGLSKEIIEYQKNHPTEQKENTAVYVGNIKRHKGLKTLLNAFSEVEDPTLKLKIIGEREGFITGLNLNENKYPNVDFTGRIDNNSLFSEIQKAKYLVQPSIYEGFGLPPLEALYLGTQPILSNIEVFKEIYEGFPVIIFYNVKDLSEKLQRNSQNINGLCERLLQKYNFQKFADKLLEMVNY